MSTIKQFKDLKPGTVFRQEGGFGWTWIKLENYLKISDPTVFTEGQREGDMLAIAGCSSAYIGTLDEFFDKTSMCEVISEPD